LASVAGAPFFSPLNSISLGDESEACVASCRPGAHVGPVGVLRDSISTFASWPFFILNQPYTLWLFAWDAAGYYSQAAITVTVANFSASENALQLSAPAGNTVTYSSFMPLTLTETLTIKNAAGQVVRTVVNGAVRSANTYNDVWDGKNDSAGLLPDGPYFYFATVTDGTYVFTWDQTNQYYNDWSGQQNPIFQAWDPFNNRPLTYSYNFSQPGRVNIVLRPYGGQGGGCSPPGFCLEQSKYEESGPHSIAWAGVDATGALRFDANWAEEESDRSLFSKNAIVLFGTKPSLTNVTATPPVYGPAIGMQTIAFDLATYQNQAATVAVTFLNQSSLSVLRTVTLTGQSPGHKTVTWDGHGDNGMWVADGPYTVTVSATDPLGNQVQGQILTTIQY
jgi:flagellar hook assembly protein FlgD